MTKKQLEEKIKDMARVGDEISEAMEHILEDPVVSAYRRRIADYESPHPTITIEPDAWINQVLANWDQIIGDLQRANVLDEIPKDAEVEEIDDSDEESQQVG